jgi:hypothetical protein
MKWKRIWYASRSGRIAGERSFSFSSAWNGGDLSPEEVSDILQRHSDRPEEIFELLEGMQFADSAEVRFVAKAEIETLRDRPIRLGSNADIDGVTLTNDANETRHIRTCREYDEAIPAGVLRLLELRHQDVYVVRASMRLTQIALRGYKSCTKLYLQPPGQYP